MKLDRPKPCCVCQKRRSKGYHGAVLVEYVQLARKKLKTEGKEIGWNEFICTSCKLIVDKIGAQLLNKTTKDGPKISKRKKPMVKKRKPNGKKIIIRQEAVC